MDNTTAQMNVVFAQLAFDVCKVPFHPDVAEVEQGQGEFYQCTAHLDGGMAGFGSTLPA